MNKRVTLEYVLCVFGGIFGLHKFYKREWIKGLLYFFTVGLFLVGWVRDIIIIYNKLPLQVQTEEINGEKGEQDVYISSGKLEKQRMKQLKKEGIPYCPKCKSTVLQYVERRKQLSVGRAVVGGVLTGGLGAAVGAVTSKKYRGKVKCLNCGKTWKK